MGTTLSDYYLGQRGLVVIPIEHLSREGLSPELRELFWGRSIFSQEWLDLFDRAFQLYWRRLKELTAEASVYWFPPRVQHVCVITEPDRVRPYFQPLHQSSWLVYESDFSPECSNLEFAIYQLIQAERMGLLQQVVPAFLLNLSYWFKRSNAEIDRFREACALTPRPDAEAYRALAELLQYWDELYHEVFKRPVVVPPEGLISVTHTGMVVPKSREARLGLFLERCERVVGGVAAGHYASFAASNEGVEAEICEWLQAERPRLLVTGAEGRVIWDFHLPDETDQLRQQIDGITDAAAESLRADLAVVDQRSRAFLGSLAAQARLPEPEPHSAEQGGLTYMHLERGEIAYNVCEEGMQRLREPAPSFERFMLAARTVHEWAHRATEAGWVCVPEARRAEEAQLVSEAAELLDQIVRDAPAGVREYCGASLASLAGGSGVGAALVELAWSRIEDFQSNLLSQRYLTAEERETYVRNNVRSLAQEVQPDALFQRLARYAYEYQYLRFSAVSDHHAYFMRSTWFPDQYLETGVVQLEHFDRLLGLFGRRCDCYSVDESKFAPLADQER